MTPKEKAEDIYDKMSWASGFENRNEQIKESAILLAEEIWNELESERVFEKYDYWHDVIQELENLDD